MLYIRQRTHIAQARVDDTMHLGNSPLDHVAEALVVDIKVLPAHRTLCPFFEFVLTVANREGISRFGAQRPPWQFFGGRRIKAHAWISPSFSRVAMSLLSSLTCSPTLPAKSSSLRLYDRG